MANETTSSSLSELYTEIIQDTNYNQDSDFDIGETTFFPGSGGNFSEFNDWKNKPNKNYNFCYMKYNLNKSSKFINYSKN